MNDCIFCKIVSGEIPSEKVYEDEETLAFLDIRPVNKGHTLVIPKKHCGNVFDMPEEAWLSMMRTAQKIAPAIKKAVGAVGMNINTNNERAAGQLVFHAHAHLIPRFENDGYKLWPQHPYPEGEAKEVAEKIKTSLQS